MVRADNTVIATYPRISPTQKDVRFYFCRAILIGRIPRHCLVLVLFAICAFRYPLYRAQIVYRPLYRRRCQLPRLMLFYFSGFSLRTNTVLVLASPLCAPIYTHTIYVYLETPRQSWFIEGIAPRGRTNARAIFVIHFAILLLRGEKTFSSLSGLVLFVACLIYIFIQHF